MSASCERPRTPWRAAGRALAAAALLAAAGCEVPTDQPGSVAVDTGEIGRLMPGAYFLLSWPTAAYHCGDKSADVQDVRNGVVTYRCTGGE
jgi:hypothetical protein